MAATNSLRAGANRDAESSCNAALTCCWAGKGSTRTRRRSSDRSQTTPLPANAWFYSVLKFRKPLLIELACQTEDDVVYPWPRCSTEVPTGCITEATVWVSGRSDSERLAYDTVNQI